MNPSGPLKVVIKQARRWFGGRKQWKFAIVGANGEPIDPRDTYANVGDIRDILDKLRSGPVELEIHYGSRIEGETLQ